jgi:cystathionine beta-lyase/cystathionine gamma-synthase
MERSGTNVFAETVCPGFAQGIHDGDALVGGLVQSTTYCREGVGSDALHQYSRVSNPTVSALERALGRLDAAPDAVCYSSGIAAVAGLLLTICSNGGRVVCGRSVYGGTTRLLREVLAGLGVESVFVDTTDPGAVGRAITADTALVLLETPANPCLELADIRAISAIAHEHGAVVAVDNTFLTAVQQRVLDLGADIAVYSTTKFIEGHSVATGGAVVSRDERLLERIRRVRKSTGSIQTPFNAWLTLNGLRTLPVRLAAQSASAARVARWLAQDGRVVRVEHPSLAAGEPARIAGAQHIGGHGAVVTFEVEGGLDGARWVVDRLSLARLVEHVGSVETLITHPATMTHADVPADQRREAGVTDGLLRLSVGLEPTVAIIEDLDRALGAEVCASEGVAV